MRAPRMLVLLLPLALAAGARALPDGTVTDDEYNFTVTVENTIDWKAMEPEKDKPHIRAHFRTEFADSDPPAYADFAVMAVPLPKEMLKYNLDKIAAKWGSAWDGWLENPRERKENGAKLGAGDKEVESYTVDVQGDYLSGVHRVTYTLAKNGKYLYILMVTRAFRAVTDAPLQEEIDAILASFRFLRVEKVEANKAAGTDDVPGAVNPGPKKPEEEKIDPEKLKTERFSDEFWKYECVKPDDLLNIPYDTMSDSEKKDNNIKLKFERNRDQNRVLIRVAVQTEAAKNWTLEQLLQQKLDNYAKLYEGKQSKDPEIDKSYKFPNAKDAIRIDLVGRRAMTERTTWILVEGKNGRQYQIEIFLQGVEAPKMWDRQIKLFLKEFKLTK